MALEMEKEDIDQYPRQSRVDPALVSDMIKLGIYPKSYTYEKGLQIAKDIAKQIWKDKGWAVDYIKDKKWYKENTQIDRHWAYRKDHMNEDMTGLKDEE